jgi:rhamnulose-1-phosphate aldolase
MNKSFFTSRAVGEVLFQVSDVARCLWEKGWAEKNAGNISVDITDITEKESPDLFHGLSLNPLRNALPGLARRIFALTATGSRMRHLAKDPEANLCFIKIDGSGKSYQQYCSGRSAMGLQPTSELPAHLAIHTMLLKNQPELKAVLHTHATELIVLTQITRYTKESEINDLLWRMHPETVIFVPKGVGFIPHTIPGTENIAKASVTALETHRAVIWEKHGVIATGVDVQEAFDTIDILAKSAEIFLRCRSAGYDPEGLSREQLGEIREIYKAF